MSSKSDKESRAAIEEAIPETGDDGKETTSEAPTASVAAAASPSPTPEPSGPPQARPRARQAPKPNSPSFDWNPKKKSEHVLAPGDRIVATDEKKGVKITHTFFGVTVYHCTIDEYEDKFCPINPRPLFEAWFPHAAPKMKSK